MFLRNSANWFPSAAVSFRRRTESSKINARIHTTKRQTQINLSPISNPQDNSSPLTSTSFMYNGIFLSGTSNSNSRSEFNFMDQQKLQLANTSHLSETFLLAHTMFCKTNWSYHTSGQIRKSIFETSAEGGLNKHHKCTALKWTKRAWETYHVMSRLLHERVVFIKQN